MGEPQIIEEGELPIGVIVGGVCHRKFSVRPAIVQDNIEAAAEVGTANPVELSTAIIARQLVTLGTLQHRPEVAVKLKAGEVMPTYIETDLLRRLSVHDYNAIERAVLAVEKKVLLGGSESSGGQPAEQLSPATTSPSSSPSASTATS